MPRTPPPVRADDLPRTVPVLFPDGTQATGTVTGRTHDFPTVTVRVHGTFAGFAVSPRTLVHLAASGKSLLL